jgi:hypothetical protein
MRIRAGYDIAFTMTQPTPMVLMLTVHPSRAKDLLAEHKLLRFFADCCCEKGAPSGQLEVKTPLYLPCPSWATG